MSLAVLVGENTHTIGGSIMTLEILECIHIEDVAVINNVC